MGKGIQIRKPESVDVKPILEPLALNETPTLPPLFYLMLFLTFPAAFVALYFLLQARAV